MRFTRFFTIILLFLTGMTSSAQTWTNVTDLYIKNADFMQGDKFWEGTDFGKVSYAYNDAEFWSMNYVKYQEINGIKHPFDEKAVVRQLLAEMKPNA